MIWIVGAFALAVAIWGGATGWVRDLWQALSEAPEHTGMRRPWPYESFNENAAAPLGDAAARPKEK